MSIPIVASSLELYPNGGVWLRVSYATFPAASNNQLCMLFSRLQLEFGSASDSYLASIWASLKRRKSSAFFLPATSQRGVAVISSRISPIRIPCFPHAR